MTEWLDFDFRKYGWTPEDDVREWLKIQLEDLASYRRQPETPLAAERKVRIAELEETLGAHGRLIADFNDALLTIEKALERVLGPSPAHAPSTERLSILIASHQALTAARDTNSDRIQELRARNERLERILREIVQAADGGRGPPLTLAIELARRSCPTP